MSVSLLFVDGDFTKPCPVSAPLLSAPLPGVATDYSLKQEFVQFGNQVPSLSIYGFSPAPLNLNYGADFLGGNSYEGFFLTSEGELIDVGGGLVKWTRTYCKKPATRYEPSNMSYLFPGIDQAYIMPGTTSPVLITRRLPEPLNSNVNIQYDYFLVGSAGVNLATPDYSSFSSIPPITHQRWAYDAYNGSYHIGLVDIIPPFVWDGGVNDIMPNGTSITATAYLAMIAAGSTFVAADSIISRWQGNIIQRITKNIVAL